MSAVTPPILLIIDDVARIRQLMSRFLRRDGFETIGVASGEEALAILQRGEPIIAGVILDFHLPGVSGPALLAQLRGENSALPVVLVSGEDTRRIRRWCMGERLQFLTKPFQVEELLQAVREAVPR